MTGTNEKLRALFLSVLMVVSVFGATVALSGTAAAAPTAQGISSNAIGPGDGTNQTVVSFDVATGGTSSTDGAKLNLTDLVDGTGVTISSVDIATDDGVGQSDDSIDSSTFHSANNTATLSVTSGTTDGTVEVDATVNVDSNGATPTRGIKFLISEDDGDDGTYESSVLTSQAVEISSGSQDTVLVSEYGDAFGTGVSDVNSEGTVQVQDPANDIYGQTPNSGTFSGVTTGKVVTIENATGTPTIDGAGSEALVVTGSSGDVTVDGLALTANDGNNVIRIEGDLLRNGGTTGSSLTIQNSVVNPTDGGAGDAIGIVARDGAGDPVAIDSLTVDNTTFERSDSSTEREIGINIQHNSGTVSITDSTFNNLVYAVQGTGTDGLQFTNNVVSNIAGEGVILNTGSSPVDFDPQANVEGGATITGNDFSSVGNAGVLFVDPSGSGSSTDFATGTYAVNNNNFTGMANTPAVATDTDYTLVGDTDVDIGVTIDATNNYYGSELGPEAQTAGVASGNGDVRDVPSADYSANAPAFVVDDGDINFRPFRVAAAPDGASVDFNFSNNFNQEVNDGKTDVNITFATGVYEDSISVYAVNTDTNPNNNQTLVEDGEIVAEYVETYTSTLDGANNTVEQISINTSLQESTTTNIKVFAKETDGSDVFDAQPKPSLVSGSVEMGGDALKLTPDSSNPKSGSQANIDIVAVDQFGNELTQDDTGAASVAVNADPADIALSFNDSANVTVNTDPGTAGGALVNGSVTTAQVTYSEIGNLEVQAFDTGSDLTLASDTTVQSYTGTVDDIEVAVDSQTLAAGGSDTVNVTATLVDANDNPIKRTVGDISFSLANSTQAGLTVVTTRESGAATAPTKTGLKTFTNGTTSIEIKGANAGYDISATAVLSDPSVSDTVSFRTVSGNVDATTSTFQLNGNTGDVATGDGVKVNTTHTLYTQLTDSNNNPIEGLDVTFTLNGSEIATVTTNATGGASTTATLPTEKGVSQLNVTGVPTFNASATGDAQINVTTIAENATALEFNSSSRSIPSGDSRDVIIQAVDEFGNANVSYTSDITLETSDVSVIDFGAGANTSTNASVTNGEATFTAAANATGGSATLTASSGNLSEVSAEYTVGSAQSIAVSHEHDVSTSSAAQDTTTLYAQLLTADGSEIDIANENVTFAVLSGSAAALDQQEADDFTVNTNSSGVAEIQVNATDVTGDTTFLAQAENFSASGQTTVTTTGAAQNVELTPETDSVSANTSVNVTVAFVDSEGMEVPKTSQISVSTDLGAFEGDRKVRPTLSADGASATVVLNSSEAGTANITATGGGVAGSGSVEFTADTEPAAPGAVQVANLSVEPNTAESNTTNTHTVTFDVMNVSDDGNTDTFVVDLGDAFANDSLVDASVLSVVDADGENISITSSPQFANNGTAVDFSVSPDSDAEFRDLTIEVNATVAAPDVSNTTEAYIAAAAIDSDNGDDVATTTVTVEPANVTTGPEVPGVSPEVSAVIAGDDGVIDADDIRSTVQAYFQNDGDIDGTTVTADDIRAAVEFYFNNQ